jgi:hypothetical protein
MALMIGMAVKHPMPDLAKNQFPLMGKMNWAG